MQLIKFPDLRNILRKGEDLSIAEMWGGFVTQKSLQLSQQKNKQIPPQIRIATVTHDNQIKPVHYLIKHETVILSQKDESHPILAGFGKDQFSIRFIDFRRKHHARSTRQIFFWWFYFISKFITKPIKKSIKTLLQKSATLNDTDITKKWWSYWKKDNRKWWSIFPLIYCWLKTHLPLKSIMTLDMKIYNCKLLLKLVHL